MTEKNIKSRIIHKHDTAAHWALAENFIPKQGELVVYDSENEKIPSRIKIGDGKTNVNNLPFIDEVEEYWKGNIAIGYAGGTGDISDPYLIATPSQLALMVNSFGQGKYYKIINDLYMSGNGYYNWFSESADVVTADYKAFYRYLNQQGEAGFFTGYIDGNYHTIYGFQCYGSIAAFIPVFGDGEIKNLRIEGSYFHSTSLQAAVFIGKTARDSYPDGRVHIDNCIVGANNQITSDTGNAAAGFIGYATIGQTTTIDNCCCLLDEDWLSSKQSWKANAFIGESFNTPYKLLNCYSIVQPINISNGDDRYNRLSTLSDAYQNVYSATTRNYQDGESEAIFKKVNIITGADSLDSMPGLENYFVEQYEDYPIISGFDIEAKSNQIAKLDGQIQNKQDKFAEVTKDGEYTPVISIEASHNNINGSAYIRLDHNDLNIGAYSSINISTGNSDINLTPYGKANYNGKEIATKKDVEELSTEFESIGKEIYTGTFGNKDKLQLLKGTKSFDVDKWDGVADDETSVYYEPSHESVKPNPGYYDTIYTYYSSIKPGRYLLSVTFNQNIGVCTAYLFNNDGSNLDEYTDPSQFIRPIAHFGYENENNSAYVDVALEEGIVFVADAYSDSAHMHTVVQSVPVSIQGAGIQSDPYLINSAEVLTHHILNNNNSYKYYKLTKDIDLGGYEWITNKDMASTFKGEIDGDNHIISNLTSKATSEEDTTTYRGLIPEASNITVRNLVLKNIDIVGYAGYSSGGIVGRFHNGTSATFENCYVQGKMSGKDGGAIIGGSGDNVTITNCGCNVDFSGCTQYAGMVGDYWSSVYIFKNCYSNGALMGKCGTSTTITNGYAAKKGAGDNYSTIITLSEMNSVKNMPGLEEAFIDVENGTPYLKSVYTAPVVNTPDNTLYVGDGSTGIKLDTDEAGYILNTETSTDLLSNTNIYVNSKTDEEYFALKYIKSQILKEVVKENYENIEKNTADISSMLPLVAMIPSMTTRSINVYKTAAAGTWTLKPNSVVMLTGQDAGANIKYIINDTTYNHKYTFFITGQLVNGNAKTYIIHANAISLMGSGIGNWMFDGIKNGQSITIEYPQNTNVIEFANDPITTLAPTSMLDVLKNEIAEEGTW